MGRVLIEENVLLIKSVLKGKLHSVRDERFFVLFFNIQSIALSLFLYIMLGICLAFISYSAQWL